MKALVLEERGRDGLHLKDIPDPQRQAGEAVMRVHASSLNRVDLYMRDSGAGITHDLPLILGVDGVGEIVESDANSTLKVGTRVALYAGMFCGKCRYCLAGDQPLCTSVNIAGEHRHGSFAQYISVPEQYFVPLPDTLSYADAGVLPTAYVTAFRMLFGKRALLAGESVLIAGASGGVAVAAIQLALLAGATVFVSSSSDEKLQKAYALGAHGGVNYNTQRVARSVIALNNGEGVDMVVDSNGEKSWGESLRSLRPGGRLVTCGATTGGNPPVEIQRMFVRQLEVYGSTSGNMQEFKQLLNVVGSGKLSPTIDSTFSLETIKQGFDTLENGEQFGKIAISIR